MFDVLMDTLSTCDAGSCQIALAAVFRALLPPDVGAVYGSRVTVFVTKLNALGAAGGAVAGLTSPKTALIRSSSPDKNSSFSASSPAHAAIATAGRNWPSAADITDDKLRGASPWAISSFATPADVVGAVSSSSFLPCWSAPIPFYVYKNKPVIDGGFSTDFAAMCAAALNGTAEGTECVRVAWSAVIGPFVKPGNADRSGKSCELPHFRRRSRSSLRKRKLLQMGVLPKAALAAEDAWLSEIDRSMAAEYPQQQQQPPSQIPESISNSDGGGSGHGEGAAAAAGAAASAATEAQAAFASAPAAQASAQAHAQAAAAVDAAAEASAVSAQSDPSAPPRLPPPPARLDPLTESLTTLSFAVASAVSNATAGASVPTPTLPETTPLCPMKEAATASWPRLTNLTSDGVAPSIHPGKFENSPLPFTACECQKLVLNLTPEVLPNVYAAGVADAAEWALANGFCGGAVGR